MLNLERAATAANYAWNGTRVGSWAEFHRVVKRPERALLARLGHFADSVLVAGCQRSGTTALTRSLNAGRNMVDFRFCPDDELAAALLLAGQVESEPRGRHCFQTTYLNDRMAEYFNHDDFRLIWMIREPAAVIYSMLNNWKAGALRRLYDACGGDCLSEVRGRRQPLLAALGPTPLEKACASYIGKTRQTFLLHQRLGERMLIVDYADLVQNRDRLLPLIFGFSGIEPSPASAERIHARSIRNGRQFSPRTAARIRAACEPVYEQARQIRTIGAGND